MAFRGLLGHLLSLLLLLLLFFATALGNIERTRARRIMNDKWGPTDEVRRRLIGPGSSPPTCRARCGRCYPCRPVHVAIQPGVSFPLEYYPEAWRCKCGNKLYMP
ncbi:EPIDERMAL PATTERNING FACTOR-like protein [Rhynchospora pubera]|uniref:Epidermal patterning factor-like protein n=1 Tax=Rhynchospora pubera TaxID=906938 RepID=A0AAV8DK18_9POAL|nr:EPIDERMAL PATTERNING FACTOR-like protein [Rhynchospora pubera]